MKFDVYLKKFVILWRESEDDLKIKAFNKAVSGFWFSLEALLRGTLLLSGKNPPERPGKLISVFLKTFLSGKEKFISEASKNLNMLYTMRKEVDHRAKIADLSYATKARDLFHRVIELIKVNLDVFPRKIYDYLEK